MDKIVNTKYAHLGIGQCSNELITALHHKIYHRLLSAFNIKNKTKNTDVPVKNSVMGTMNRL